MATEEKAYDDQWGLVAGALFGGALLSLILLLGFNLTENFLLIGAGVYFIVPFISMFKGNSHFRRYEAGFFGPFYIIYYLLKKIYSANVGK